MPCFFELKEIFFNYDNQKDIIQNLSLKLNKGTLLSIIGPSGSGKSTILRLISLLNFPNRGNIYFEEQCVFSKNKKVSKKLLNYYKSQIGMVFQELFLWPHLTVIQNIMLPQIKGINKSADKAKKYSIKILEDLSLLEYSEAYPDNLSVGQKQRCAIARTLAMDPKLLLLDEITSALDPELVISIMNTLKKIVLDSKRTVILVTHEMNFAKKMSDEIAYLKNGKLIFDSEQNNK